MALPQHVICNVGGTVSIDLLSPPTNSNACSVSVLDGAGGALITAGTVTVSSISTTLNGAVAAGASSVVCSNASTISAGDSFWIRTPDEKVRCKSKSSNTVTLWRPLLQAHASNSSVVGTKITASINSAVAVAPWWDGRVQWTIDSVVAHYTAVECTRYPLARLATVEDLAAIDPLISVALDSEADVERMLDAAHEDVLSDIGARGRARVFTASTEFIRACAFRFLENYYIGASSDGGQRLHERYRARATQEITKIVEVAPRDADQDGVVETDDKISVRSVRLYRG